MNTTLTLKDSTELNRILFTNEMRKGTIRIIPKDEFHFIKNLNEANPFKMPEFMKSVETNKSYTNREPRITKVFWVMDLTNGQRLLSYHNPNSIKTLHNSRLTGETITNHGKLLVPSNVQVLWRLDATYLIEDGVEQYDSAEVRCYK